MQPCPAVIAGQQITRRACRQGQCPGREPQDEPPDNTKANNPPLYKTDSDTVNNRNNHTQ